MSALKSSVTENSDSSHHKLSNLWRYTFGWFSATPERALEAAYKAAQAIQTIELEHFNGNKISSDSANYTESVTMYWQKSLNNNLNIIRIRLTEFRISSSWIKISTQEILEKLKFIDSVINKYIQEEELIQSAPISKTSTPSQIERPITTNLPIESKPENEKKPVRPMKKTGLFPRSIGRTFNRIRDDFSPKAEEQYVQKFRLSRKRTQAAVRFLLMLVFIPLLTHQIAKQFLVAPIVEHVQGENSPHIFLNTEMEDEALKELKMFRSEKKFESLVLKAPTLSPAQLDEKVKEKALEIAKEFRHKSNNAISNVFSDIFSLIAFAVVVATSKREIAILKIFIDDVVYGLSDSAKAFLIILFTDIFVGFHSPHGWEVILEGMAEHLGLPANHSAMSLFIATFPVVLDTVFKYWIFRYLSRLSPSALATLKEMNE